MPAEPAARPRGGIRPGAGRPHIPEGRRRVQITIQVAPQTAAWLQARRTDERRIGHVVDDLVAEKMGRDDPTEY